MNKSRRLEIFDKVRQQYGDFLTAVLWKLTGEKELFAEAYQIALLKIWQNIEKLNSLAAGAYIYRIALSANSLAWKKRISKDGHISIEQSEIEPAAVEQKIDDELIETVRREITKLPEKQSAALVMRYLEQKNYDVIAEKLNCSEVSARSNVSKAIAALKKKLGIFSAQEH
jgi:RNA polymerase sigma factor (sigma-70 family)